MIHLKTPSIIHIRTYNTSLFNSQGIRKLRPVTGEELRQHELSMAKRNNQIFNIENSVSFSDIDQLLKHTEQQVCIYHTRVTDWCHVEVCSLDCIGPIQSHNPKYVIDDNKNLVNFKNKETAISAFRKYLKPNQKRITCREFAIIGESNPRTQWELDQDNITAHIHEKIKSGQVSPSLEEGNNDR